MGRAASGVFEQRRSRAMRDHARLLGRRNAVDPEWTNGVFERYRHPVLTAAHVPLEWRYDFDPASNPRFLERLGVNCVFNAGALAWQDGVIVVARVEGVDRKSFFAIAQSPDGLDRFRFWDEPLRLPDIDPAETNVYDMRLTRHEDGWIYGLFCSEAKDPSAPPGDESAAVAACGIVRTRDLRRWERLPNLRTRSAQQRNVVLHPEFVDGAYALYTRPQDGFIETGSGGGIGWATCRSMESAEIGDERIVDPKRYHTIREAKNGQGPPPLRTDRGWLHLAHGVRNTAAGLRYVLYLLMTDLNEPWRVTHRPGGYFLAPEGGERVGDVSNVAFSNGWVARRDGRVLMYYGASDTRLHVAVSDLDRLVDFAVNTPPEVYRSADSVAQRLALIEKNRALSAAPRARRAAPGTARVAAGKARRKAR